MNWRAQIDRDLEELQTLGYDPHKLLGLDGMAKLAEGVDDPGENCEWDGSALEDVAKHIHSVLGEARILNADAKVFICRPRRCGKTVLAGAVAAKLQRENPKRKVVEV